MAQRIYILPDKGNLGRASGTDVSEIRETQKPTAERAREVFRQRAERAQDALRGARNHLAATGRTAIDRVRRVANESPLHLVAAIAGAAFALGVVLRIWRSRQHG